MSSSDRIVLPKNVKPINYKVTIVPGLETFKFTGQVSILVNVLESTSTIVVNSKELEIKNPSLVILQHQNGADFFDSWSKDAQTGRPTQTGTVELDTGLTTAKFTFPHEIPKDSTAILHIEFDGTHNDEMAGFYRSQYKDEQGNKKHLVVTQFEAVDCRRCFPCWDEPNQKATFDITLIVPKNTTALSNMNVISESEILVGDKMLKKVDFATTPIMSTYLVALAVGEFDYLESVAHPQHPDGATPIVCRTYTLKGQSHLGKFSLDVAVKTLEFFSEYFDIAYPLPKMDMIAIPDFAAGAMENWGLVTYREEAVLFDPVNSNNDTMEEVAYTVGHELAHQWFGNLVTMDWWDELWLNEGFATFVGWLAVDKLFPDWNVFKNFIGRDYSYGANLDSQRSSHPIQVAVSSAAEIDQIFDAISYCKGASVIRMLESYLGREKFAKGVNQYLKKHKFGNATTIDLWAALSNASGVDVGAMMNDWTLSTGYPLIQIVGETYDSESKELTLELKQERFLATGDLKPEEDTAVWYIPIAVNTSAGTTQHVLATKTGSIKFAYQGSGDFYKLNANVTGFYRICYSVEQLQVLSQGLSTKFESFSVEDRIGILSDVFSFAKNGLVSTSGALEILTGFQNEDTYIVLEEISNRLAAMKTAWGLNPQVIAGLKSLSCKIFSGQIKKLGFEYDPSEDRQVHLKRTLAITALASNGHEETIAALLKIYEDSNGGKSIHPELRKIVFKTQLWKTTNPVQDFNRLVSLSVEAPTVDERLAALASIGSINSPELVDRILNEIVFDREIVRLQDFYTPLISLVGNQDLRQENIAKLSTWLISNWSKIHETLAGSMGLLGNTCKICLQYSLGNDILNNFESWFKGEGLSGEELAAFEKSILDAKRPIMQALESIKSNTAWYERENANVQEWIAKML